MEFSRLEYWSGDLLFSSPGDLLNPGTEPRSPTLQAGSLPAEPPGKPGYIIICQIEKILSIFFFAVGCKKVRTRARSYDRF